MQKFIPFTLFLLLAVFGFGQSLSDIDGNTYSIIEINGQEWMGENLKTTRYNDGTEIQSYTEAGTWKDFTDGGYAVPEIPGFDAQYGKLYNGYAVQTGKLCPAGWEVPSPAVWNELIASESLITPSGNLNSLGTQLKSERQVNHPDAPVDAHPRWDEHDKRFGTDQFGFAALPAGNINAAGSFANRGSYAYFWTSGTVSESEATAMVMLHSHKGLSTTDYPKAAGFSVRCIKSDGTPPPPPTTYTLLLSTNGNGNTTPGAGTHEYTEGTEVSLTATPDAGWEFEKWVIDGEDIMNASTSVTMNDDVNAVARFTEIILPPTTYTLLLNTNGNGSTTPAAGTHEYNEGTEVTLTATPTAGWEFEKWVIDGEEVATAETTVTVNNDITAIAWFTEIVLPPTTYTLTLSTNGNGNTIPAAGTHEYDEGTEVSLNATPAEGWEFEKWVIDGADVMDASTSVTMSDDVNAMAHFTETDDGLNLPHVMVGGEKLYVFPSDHTSALPWGGDGITTGANSDADGFMNTQLIIIMVQNNEGIAYAAQYCNNLEYEGIGGWYLPSKNELDAIYQAKDEIGGFDSASYWSSTEYNDIYAWHQSFEEGWQDHETRKYNTLGVRCVKKADD